MSEKDEVIQLEGVPIQWLSTPEGRKRAQKKFFPQCVQTTENNLVWERRTS